MSTLTTSSSDESIAQNKISEKPSEAYFDRYYQNISNFYNKLCPSNPSHTSKTESQICATMLKCPSQLFCKRIDNPEPHYWHLPHTAPNARHKCICKKFALNTTSSCSSIASDHFPLKLNTLKENMYSSRKIKTPQPPAELLREECSIKKLDIVHEQYYSCYSDDSESDQMPEKASPNSGSRSKTNKTLVILELLQKVVRLISKNNIQKEDTVPFTPEASSRGEAKSEKITTKESEVKTEPKSATTTDLKHHQVWPFYSCFCCKHAMASGPDFHQPYNMISSASVHLQIPEPCVHSDCSDGCHNETKINISDIFSDIDATKQAPFENLDSIPCLPVEVLPQDRGIKSVSLASLLDEEIQPCYMDKIFTSSFHINEPSPDSLMEYDDEEPNFPENFALAGEEIHSLLVDVTEFSPQPGIDSLLEYDDEEPIYLDRHENVAKSKELENTNEPLKLDDKHAGYKILDQECSVIVSTTEDMTKLIQEILLSTAEKASPYIQHNSLATGSNIYHFLPDIDKPNDSSKQLIIYEDSEEEEEEEEEEKLLYGEDYKMGCLEKITEKRKIEIPLQPSAEYTKVAAPLKNLKGERSSTEQMMFFIDSLIMDFEAMDYARRKTQNLKNICMTKIGLCDRDRDSFPVTITDVTELGANSLYVEWKIHNYFGIDGYEIYTDGYLTNRYYNSRHKSAVITHVDVTLPHKVALVAQARCNDNAIEEICNMNKNKNILKSLPCNAVVGKHTRSYSTLWTPSIFLYDPITCKAAARKPIVRDNI